MTDELREALDDWVQEYVWLLQQHAPQVTLEPLEEVIEAARAHLDCQRETIWWCEECGLGAEFKSDMACPHRETVGEATLTVKEQT